MFTSGYRPKATCKAPAKPPNEGTSGRKAETVYHVHWHGELPKQRSFGVIPGVKVREMTTSVRLVDGMFVVRINGCTHRLSEADADELRMKISEKLKSKALYQVHHIRAGREPPSERPNLYVNIAIPGHPRLMMLVDGQYCEVLPEEQLESSAW